MEKEIKWPLVVHTLSGWRVVRGNWIFGGCMRDWLSVAWLFGWRILIQFPRQRSNLVIANKVARIVNQKQPRSTPRAQCMNQSAEHTVLVPSDFKWSAIELDLLFEDLSCTFRSDNSLGLLLGSLEFNSSAMLTTNQLVHLQPVTIPITTIISIVLSFAQTH